MIKKNLPLILLCLFTLLGFAIRFYKLGQAPAGLYLDEAAQGYNAYSILKTGKDEFGKSFPIVFRSFRDFKTPVYIYLIVPLIPVFGLTPFTVRLPSFIFSVLTLPLVYYLMRKLLPKARVTTPLALVSVLLLAISPWHTLFGRTNFECNVALFFLLAAIYCFYVSLKKPSLLIVSAILFAITIPAYHSQRVIVPILLVLLFVRHRRPLLSHSHLRPTVMAFVVGALLSLPSLVIMATPGFLARASTLNIFTQTPSGYLSWYQGPLSSLINANWYLTSREFLSLYLSYFSPRNLFFLGDYGPRSSFPDLATFFTWQLPFYFYGLYRLVKEKPLGELRYIVLVLLLISPIPAAVTRDPFTTIRALPMVVPISIVISLGLIRFFQLFRNVFAKKIMVVGFGLVVVYSLLNLYSSAIVLNEYFRAAPWEYGWEQVITKLNTLDPKLPVVIDNARAIPYSQILFFTKYDPLIYQQTNFEVSPENYYIDLTSNTTKYIGRITVRSINWEPDLIKEQYLVGDSIAISLEQIKLNKMTLLEEIKYPDGTPAFRIVLTNPKYQKAIRRLIRR
ncbi:MAG: hypothetical protein UX31_C0032G0005 [Candidatus Nomurabacteria bacterium GW2011_GWA1_46_11]|uniref:Glycosyltransferase RgtA/B/C/D-like domain-containing protein n=1 Tax=Candidatus Nomurabacteria bacterium GW2011_GWA1_46_11 TaxID=1618732 RepID=A0A0G1RIE6_9BACT|nr:MAG: hypothetical protein UX31_C0032G0005 [Candidatus Nomurabacteria bacterium GW2011_GWA1_46_11]HLE49941.1 glycosyltransferase family 39 protein [Patescibacteria group bacterium]